MKLYKDGVEVDSATGIVVPTAGDSYIGSFADVPGLTLKVYLDDVRLYNRALTAEEILGLYGV